MDLKNISFILAAVFLVFVNGFARKEQNLQKKCGERQIGQQYVAGGKRADILEYPWLVAFRYRPVNNFFCGGSLVSAKHVISAAHCFKEKGGKEIKPAQYVIALLGKHDLNINDEEGAVEHAVWEFILHEDWKNQGNNFDADISLVVLEEEYNLNEKSVVKIVCLPPASDAEVTGEGNVVGWGISEQSEANKEDHDSIPNKVKLPAVTQKQCFKADDDFVDLSSNRTFCAGELNTGMSACQGDSGGGFFLRDSTRSFYLGGIVSASLISRRKEACRNNTYTVFTDVSKFIPWIEQKMEETKEIQWKEVEFECKKESCTPHCTHNFMGEFTRNLKFHQSDANFTSSTDLRIQFQPSNHIFFKIGENFPKLKRLFIDFQAIKYVERSNFDKMEKVIFLTFKNNEISYLPADVFDDMTNLEYLNLSGNKIKMILPGIFNNLRKLQNINLSSNRIVEFPSDLFLQNLDLKAIETYYNPGNSNNLNLSRIPNVELNFRFEIEQRSREAKGPEYIMRLCYMSYA